MEFKDVTVRQLKPKASAYRVFEKSLDKGFGVKVTPAGAKSFILAYTISGKKRFMNLGSYPSVSLTEARKRARRARNLVDQGIDPQEHEKQAKIEREVIRREQELRGSVQQLFAHYIEYLKKEKSEGSAIQVEQAYDKDVTAVIAPETKANEVTIEQCKLVIHRVASRGSLVQSNRVRSYMMAAFKHGIEHDNNPLNLKAEVMFGLSHNPVRDIPRVVKKEKVGNRDLSGAEIGIFWRSLYPYNGMDYLTKLALRLILATGGLRVQEVVAGRWSEVDIERALWELPGERTKNRKPHVVPLGDTALSILAELRQLTGSTEFLFPKRGDDTGTMPLASMSKALNRYCKREKFEPFTPRDLRRTCKSRMGEIGLSKEIRDRLHNHALNDVSSKHYDRYDYLPEKTRAIEAWDQYLQMVISNMFEQHKNVVPLKL